MSDERQTNARDKRIGQRVRSRRLEIGMSQERLAELLGVTFQQVQKYEKGVNRIAASRLFDIAQALDKPVGQFFDGFDDAPASDAAHSAAPGAELYDLPKGHAIAALIVSASPATRELIWQLVKAAAAHGAAQRPAKRAQA